MQHPRIHDKYPPNLSAYLTLPFGNPLNNMGEARTQGYREKSPSTRYSHKE